VQLSKTSLKRQKAVTSETRKKEMGKQFLEAAAASSRTAVNGTCCIQTEASEDDKKATNKQFNNNANKKAFCCQENTLFLISIIIAWSFNSKCHKLFKSYVMLKYFVIFWHEGRLRENRVRMPSLLCSIKSSHSSEEFPSYIVGLMAAPT